MKPTPIPPRNPESPRPTAQRSIAALAVALALVLAGGAAGAARAADGGWTVELQPVYMELSGHDQHVLTVAGPDGRSSVELDTDSGPAYRGELLYDRGRWSWGLELFWFSTSQGVPDRTATAGSFEVVDRSFTADEPGEVLFYRVLEDTDVAMWTADLFARRTLREGPGRSLDVLVGIRNADFDNDYRAVVGIDGVAGRRLDASSNYGRMIGPLVGLAGTYRLGRSTIDVHLGQSVVLGDVELSSRARELTGPFGEAPSFVGDERFRTDDDVTIPITELRVQWTYGLTEHLALGVGVDGAAWWDVPVPPGVVPGDAGIETLHENTLVLAGGAAVLKVEF